MVRLGNRPATRSNGLPELDGCGVLSSTGQPHPKQNRGKMMMDFDLLILVAVALVVAAVASLVAIKAWRHHSDERRIRKHLGK